MLTETPDIISVDPTDFQQLANFASTIEQLTQIKGVISKNIENIDDLDEHFGQLYSCIDSGLPYTALAFPAKRTVNDLIKCKTFLPKQKF